MPYSLALALAALAVTAAATPLVMALARRAGALDHPGPRRLHAAPVPTLGGLAIAVAVLGVAWAARALPGPAAALDAAPLLGLTIAAIPILALGIADDLRDTPPWLKLAAQAGAALILVRFGYGVPVLTNPFGGTVAAGWLDVPLTVLWVLLLTNAVNLIDGLDGLAAGIVLIAALTLWWVARGHGDFYVMFLGAIVAGAAFGFFLFNAPPARVFMGDTGSQFLGLLLSAMSLLENRKGTTAVTLLFPLVALGLPIADSVRAFARRLASGRPVFIGDSGHIHHRLLQLGLSPRGALVALLSLGAILGLVAVVLAALPRHSALVLAGLLALALFVLFEALEAIDRRRSARRPPPTPHA